MLVAPPIRDHGDPLSVEIPTATVDILTLGYGENSVVVADPLAERNNFAGRQRMLGWLDVLTAAGVTPRVVLTPFRPAEAADEGARLLLDTPDPPTAVLCFSDVYAESVLHAAHALGLRVPDDLSLVGFDDNPLAARLEPPLTTVRQDIQAKGRAAVAALAAVLKARQDGVAEPTDHLALPVELVVRASSGPAPKRSLSDYPDVTAPGLS